MMKVTVLYPSKYLSIVSIDKTNKETISIDETSKNGFIYMKSCLIPNCEPYTIEEYHNKFCKYNEIEDKYYYFYENNFKCGCVKMEETDNFFNKYYKKLKSCFC